MLKVIRLKINGREQETAVDDRESLLDTLRRLSFASVKKGCEVGECGACMALVDGEAIDSYIYLSIWADGGSIIAVEDLKGPNGKLSPIQKAFIEEVTVRRRFCTPGLTMSVMRIAGVGKKYDREELKKPISGHLCCYTSYRNILNAMERIVEEAYRVVGEWGEWENRKLLLQKGSMQICLIVVEELKIYTVYMKKTIRIRVLVKKYRQTTSF